MKCPVCGTELPEDSIICTTCGNRIKSVSSASFVSSPSTPSQKKTRWPLYFLGAAILLAGIIFLLFSKINSTTESVSTDSEKSKTGSILYSVQNSEGGSLSTSTKSGLLRYQIDTFGNKASVKAVPDQGYRFVRWSDGYTQPDREDVVGSSDKTLYAIFEKQEEELPTQNQSDLIPQSEFEIVPENKQKIIVTASGNTASLELLTYRNTNWEIDFQTTAALGSNGITKNKVEGDHMTPAGTFRILFAFSSTWQNTKLPFIQIVQNDIWICNPNSSFYNTLQSKNDPSGDWKEKGDYENIYVKFTKKSSSACIYFDFNGDGLSKNSAEPGRGSALFLDGVGENGNMYSGYGDIKISSSDMAKILAILDPNLSPIIIIQ